MAIIYSYPTATPVGTDTIIGTQQAVDETGDNLTVTFTMASIANYVTASILPSGTTNYLPLFSSPSTFADSIVSQVLGNYISINGNLTVANNGIFQNFLTVQNDLYVNGEIQGTTASLGATNINGTLDMSTSRIINLGAPLNPQDAATKAYVDAGDLESEFAVTLRQSARFTEAVTIGDPIYITGYNTGLDRFEVARAQAGDPSKMPAVGLADGNYGINEDGNFITHGGIEGLNTNSFDIGDVAYVGALGGLTKVKPTGSNLIQNIGIVSKKSSGNGALEAIAIGRTNDVPNIPRGSIWVGNVNGVATPLPIGSTNQILTSNGTDATWQDNPGQNPSLNTAGNSGTGNVDLDTQSLTVAGGTYITTSASGQTITANHDDTNRSDTTRAIFPPEGGNFEVIDELTTNTQGHVTGIRTTTITLPDDYLDGNGTANTIPLWDDTDTLGDSIMTQEFDSGLNKYKIVVDGLIEANVYLGNITDGVVPYQTPTGLADSILSQGTNPASTGLVTNGDRIKVDGTTSVKDSLTINYTDGTYPRPFPPYIPAGEFNTEPTGRIGVVNEQDSLEWAFSATSIGGLPPDEYSNRSGILHGSGNDYKLSLSNDTERTVFLNSFGDSFINGGQLGIGTAIPTEKLDVAGTVKAYGVKTTNISVNNGSQIKLNRAVFFNTGNINNIEGPDIGATLHLRTNEPLAAQSVIALTRGGQGTGFPSGITQNASGDYTFLLRDPNNNQRIKFVANDLSAGDSLIDSRRIVLCGNTFNQNGGISIDGRKWSNGARNAVMKFYKSSTTDADTALEFRDNTTLRGSIVYSSGGTNYNVTSDYRLKENVVEITDGIERLKQLKPSRFNFISNTEKVVDGFIAHEVQDIVPEAVTGLKDATEEYEVTPAEYDDYGDLVSEAVMGTRDAYQQIDQAKIVPLLTAALQEAVAKIESLEARIQALESN